MKPGDRYVALGSSFAAGPGVGTRAPASPRRAGRSSANYAHVLAARLGLDLDDQTYSGATTTRLLEPERPSARTQVDAVTPGTRLVTITAGGNDVGYLPALVAASLPAPAALVPVVRRRRALVGDARQLDRAFIGLEESLVRLVREVRNRAPESVTVLVGYLTVLPDDAATSTRPLPASTAAWGRAVGRRLAETTGRVADAESCLYADAAQVSRDHHAWAPVPWTRRFHYSLRGGAPYHPNAAGMVAVADLVVATLAG